ncbi:hypothetical protein [Salinarchaeum laminariae]|uniref:hypothetical protein n=1 Tax=Salinarchaeum laminariae TaxID=869888 RepID=UPI0020BF4053|nr:hypothetical protein [Salinarchaeum laminariae]
MIPGLDGEIHGRTMVAIAMANFGGLGAGIGAEHFGWLGYIGVAAVALYGALWYTPDAETVTSDWIDYQREQQTEGSDA